MPQLGESATEGTVGGWLKQLGERVEKYDPLVEVETDKVNAEIPSPLSGILREIYKEAGTTVPIGESICCIDEDELEPDNEKKLEKDEEKDNHGEEKTDGETQADVTTQHERSARPQIARQTVISPVEAPFTHTQKYDETPRIPIKVFPGDEIVPLTPMRRQIAEHMVRSERTAPHVTAVMETDMTKVVTYRNARKEEFLQREGVELTYLPFAIKAGTLALRDHPRLNAVFDEDRIIHRKALNIGIAVALEDGLIVPVIKNADRLSIAGLAHAIADLTSRARRGNLTPDDVRGGTFTVNNTGTFGTIASTPIIVQPQVAILATEAIVKRPVVVDDTIAIRSMMNLSLSFDHRVLDGLAGTAFMKRVRELLESVNENTPLY